MSWKIAGINFDHFHMGDLLRLVNNHPDAEIVGICDEQPQRMEEAQRNFQLPDDRVFTDHVACLEKTQPDLVILCPAAARHAEWTEKVAPFGTHILMEKPFAASVQEADRMVAAMKPGKRLVINWPMVFQATHHRTHALIREGAIGTVKEVRYYNGNRGPLWHGADKIEKEPTAAEKDASWFYKKAEGGGSLQDYLGYGTTLGTWFHGGATPSEVTAVWDEPDGLEVDEQSITVARYAHGLSKFETRWGTFTDPWIQQPQPTCGFVVVGSEGTIASQDYADHVRMQTRERPEGIQVEAPPIAAPQANPVQYVLHCLESGDAIEGPLSLETSRIGQRIVDTARLSAEQKRTLPLVD